MRTQAEQLRLVLQRALIELEYAQEHLRDRIVVRADVIAAAKSILAATDGKSIE